MVEGLGRGSKGLGLKPCAGLGWNYCSQREQSVHNRDPAMMQGLITGSEKPPEL